MAKSYNRPTHYNKKPTTNTISPMFLIDENNYLFLKELADFENTSISKIVQISIENYKLKNKGVKNALKKSKNKYLKKNKKRK